jgi:predicted P-loop ATPase
LFYCPRHPEGQSRNACSDGAVFLDPDGLGIKGSEPAKGTNLKILREGVNASKDKEGRALARELLDGTLRLVKGSRDNDLHKAVWTLTMSSNPVITRDALKAVLAPVLASMEGSDEQDWESKALFSYERALANREREEAQVAAARAIIDPQGPETQWKSLLKTKRDKNGNEVLVPHTSNVAIILEHDERIKGIRFNALRRHIEVTEGELKGKAEETLDTTLSNWLHTNWDLNIHRSECGAALIEHAMKHSFDPVGKFLNGLEWDGVPRLDTMLLKYCKAEGNEQFIRRASRKFMISAVARALSPGCQVDTVLVLSGAQGGGKTSFVRILGQGFHVETKIDVHSKDAVMVATSNWLVELSEMSSVKRGDVESVRAFLTNRSDQIRLPYARAVGNYARRCVFIGTTNSDQPLTDRDGNRRYWVISVGTIDTAALEQDVKQLWAEAVHAYKAGEIWHMTQEEALLAANEMSAYTEDDFYGVRILRWLEQCGSKRPQVLTAFEVAQDVLHLDPKESQQSASTIRVALKNLGWEKSFVRRHGSRVWGYKVPQMTDEVLKELRMQKEAEFKSQKEARA